MNDLDYYFDLKKMRRYIFTMMINDNPSFRALCVDMRDDDGVGVIDTKGQLTFNLRWCKKQGAEITVFSRLLKIPNGGLYKLVYYSMAKDDSFNSPVGMALGTVCGSSSIVAFHRVSSKEFEKLSDHGVEVIDWSDEFEVQKKKVRVFQNNTSAQR